MTGSVLDRLLTDPRVTQRSTRPRDPKGRCVVYWMQRAQRGRDNPALDLAIDVGNELGLPVVVHLGHVPFFPHATARAYAFLFEGVADVAADVERRGSAFAYRPYPDHRIDAFAREVGAALVIGDENPLRETEQWRKTAAERLPMALFTVDADVVVPTSTFDREEYAARTIRPKIHRVWHEFLVPSEEKKARKRFAAGEAPRSEPCDAAALMRRFEVDESARPTTHYRGGTKAGTAMLNDFVANRLAHYHERRNHPEDARGSSLLSPWLHFGHLGPRGVALAAMAADAPDDAKNAFLEELIVRRELAINFVKFNRDYDRYECGHAWALKTLEEALKDTRPVVYTEEQFELAKTHDPLWNAAQLQMVETGHMHNYVRMYWAKKILEWTKHPRDAFDIAVRLNDRYELDGRDPNGYTGVAWAIVGKHDRPWAPARPIFGMIRFMSLASTGRKFDSKAYIARWTRRRDSSGLFGDAPDSARPSSSGD